MNNFWQRTITGAIFLVVMIGGMLYSYWSLCALFFLISMLGLNELYTLLAKHNGLQPQRWMGLVVGAIMFALFAFKYQFTPDIIFLMLIPLLLIIFLVELYRKKDSPFANIAVTVTGIIYVVLPFAMWVSYICPFSTTHNQLLDELANDFLPPVYYNPHVLIAFFILIWTNDTGAYITGRLIGKHKLWERISPKKTWEGFIGGIVFSLVAAFLIYKYYTMAQLSLTLWLIIGLTVSIFGTMGDLTKSMFKRSMGIKDSGGILPGHGGILDRFDAVLIATPIVLAIIQISSMVSLWMKVN